MSFPLAFIEFFHFPLYAGEVLEYVGKALDCHVGVDFKSTIVQELVDLLQLFVYVVFDASIGLEIEAYIDYG